MTIDASSVDTRDENRDNHLRTNDFFDVENHPTWTFVSTAITPNGPTEWKVDGRPDHPGRDQAGDPGRHPRGRREGPLRQPPGGFSAKTSINREDFGVAFGAVMEAGGLVVAKKVDIEIETEATLAGLVRPDDPPAPSDRPPPRRRPSCASGAGPGCGQGRRE